ncbi:hypothetical protein [Streptomyces olivaceus]|uniref:hypothetical protein n=1 Tax=Streptomyces olivaceus TaxID=47716 RepID=UPI0004CA6C8D|nr:hypothetical protein [Streptomyces olivaceus]MBZ6102697.1 hypothetical protein [Streptomyces olivaceus]
MQQHEELHGNSDTCLNGVLHAVPPEVRQQAEAISCYVKKASGQQIADKAAETWGDLMDAFFGTPKDEAGAEATS